MNGAPGDHDAARRRKAAEEHRTTFDSNKPCRKCGTVARYVGNGGCVSCQRYHAKKRKGPRR